MCFFVIAGYCWMNVLVRAELACDFFVYTPSTYRFNQDSPSEAAQVLKRVHIKIDARLKLPAKPFIVTTQNSPWWLS
jgi:hypothetical protein